MDLERLNPKHKALLALVASAQAFLDATAAALDEKYPGTGRSKDARDLLDQGKAHLAISVQMGSGRVVAALALVHPQFVTTIETPDMTLNASLASVFGDPEAVTITDLGKLN